MLVRFELATRFDSFDQFAGGVDQGMYSDATSNLSKVGGQIYQIGIGFGFLLLICSVLLGAYLFASNSKENIQLGKDRIKRGFIGIVALSGTLLGLLTMIFSAINSI